MVGFRRILCLLVIAAPVLAYGQVNRYVVFFKDKTSTPFSVNQPAQFLSSKSLERRTKQNISITNDDLPVDPNYVAQVRAAGARTYFTSRWMNCVLVQIGSDSVALLESIPFVSKVEFVAPGKKLPGGRIGKTAREQQGAAAAETSAQLRQLGLDEMHTEGFHGEGVSIAIFDGGFQGVDTAPPFAHLFQNNQIKFTYDYVGKSGNVYQYDEHGTEVLSVIGGLSPGTFVGGAYGAAFYLFVTEEGAHENRIEEYNWLMAAEKADSAGVDIISTSLGYSEFDDPGMDYTSSDLDGNTAVVTRAAVSAMQRGMVVVCSAGNEGDTPWHYITPPADAEGILSVGAITLELVKVPFSSVGPTADGRIKPDVVALGYNATVILPDGSIGSRSGTSFACPLISSLAAGVWQAYPQLNASQVYDAIIRSASQVNHPDNLKGYGLPNFAAVRNYLQSPEMAEDIALYPNPVVHEALHLQFKKPTGESVTVTIYDCLGRTLSESVVQSSWVNNPIQINVDAMTSGLYLIQVKSPSIVKTFRWCKV